MAMTTCKACNHDIRKGASTCPSCGAKAPKRWGIWTKLLAVIFGIWLVGQLSLGLGSKPGTPSQTPPRPKTPHEEVTDGLKFDYSWNKGGFSSVMLINASITNNSPYTIKDLVIRCEHSANSGTQIDSNSKTVYETIASGKTLKLREFNMGFIHSQATRSSCEVSDFEIVTTRQPA